MHDPTEITFIRRIAHLITRKCRKHNLVVRLRPKGKVRGHVLLSYLTEPFLFGPETKRFRASGNRWECRLMAKTWLGLGYNVDVIDFNNYRFKPRTKYHIIIDIHENLERLHSRLPRECVRILHLTGSHWLFQNSAEYARLAALYERRKAMLIPRRYQKPFNSHFLADYVTLIGNEKTAQTYPFIRDKMTSFGVTPINEFPFNAGKNWKQASSRFLWLGSSGMVHKGLDLTLEAFAQMPEYHLTITGPLQSDEAFMKVYAHELQMPNVTITGTLDLTSDQFKNIVSKTIACILPSCSEGQAGSVISAMHAGLIPIVSYATGVTTNDFGYILAPCTISSIIKAVNTVASLPQRELANRSQKSWQYVREHNTRERFAFDYVQFAERVIQERAS